MVLCLQLTFICVVQEVGLLEGEWAVAQRWESALAAAGRGSFQEADVGALGHLAAENAGSLCQESCAAGWPLHLQLEVRSPGCCECAI